jgi:hypothetical protein
VDSKRSSCMEQLYLGMSDITSTIKLLKLVPNSKSNGSCSFGVVYNWITRYSQYHVLALFLVNTKLNHGMS